jgi:Type III restriction enzyme, res subunit/Helicase associated domain/Helicase conserved C-terminal domain
VSTSTVLRPREQQIEQLAALATVLALHDRAQLIAACGGGKTLTGRWHAQASGARLVIVLVPSLALVAQTLGEWRRAGGWRFTAQVICSDPGTAEGAAERADEGGSEVADGFWRQVSASVTTDPALAAVPLRKAAGGRPHVVFCTYHSAAAAVAACKLSGTVFDLLIADEAHHLAGRPRPAFRLVLDRRALPARKRLFMTATPEVITGNGALEDTLSMDDRHVFGPVAHTYSFGAAIRAGQLADYQVVCIARRAGDLPAGSREAGVLPYAVLRAAAGHGLRSLLSFHNRNADAAAFAAAVNRRRLGDGRVAAARAVRGKSCTDGAGFTAARARDLAWLAAVPGDDGGGGECRIISSARCLQEGVDIPAVDGIVFADPRKSVTDVIQAVGRALRPAPGKTTATIIVPVSLPDDGDDDTELITSEFKVVWAVLRALRAHDERLAEEIDAGIRSRASMRHGRGGGLMSRILFDLPPGLDESAIRTRLVEESASGWERLYQALAEYAQIHGAAPASWRVVHDGRDLGIWCQKQRAAHRDGLLAGWKAQRLEQVPGWCWEREHGAWMADYTALRDLAGSLPGGLRQDPAAPSIYGPAGRGGSAGVKDRLNRPMGYWVALQRQLYRDGMLDERYAAMLEELPGWDWNGGLPGEDVAMIQALRLYAEFEKHGNVPEAHVEDGLELGRWVWAIRRRKLTGRLHPALLEEIAAAVPRRRGSGTGRHVRVDFSWEHIETQWRLVYSGLRQYVRETGSAAAIPYDLAVELPDATVQAGQWVSLQRHKHRTGTLDPRFAAWLEALPGWVWDPGRTIESCGEPVTLPGGLAHGSPAAYGSPQSTGTGYGCKCGTCVMARRARDRVRGQQRQADRLDRLGGPVSALEAKIAIARLEAAGVTRGRIATCSAVPLGVIRDLAAGRTDLIGRQHDKALRAVTLAAVRAMPARTGSRGREVSAGTERIDAGPTIALLQDLRDRGFGPAWVARELDYATHVFHLSGNRARISRRVAGAVRDLHQRTGDLKAPPRQARRALPPLSELLAPQQREQAS